MFLVGCTTQHTSFHAFHFLANRRFFVVESLTRDFFVVFLPSCACWIRERERIYCTFVRHAIVIWHYIFIRESNICHVSLTRCANDGDSTFIVVTVAHRVWIAPALKSATHTNQIISYVNRFYFDTIKSTPHDDMQWFPFLCVFRGAIAYTYTPRNPKWFDADLCNIYCVWRWG